MTFVAIETLDMNMRVGTKAELNENQFVVTFTCEKPDVASASWSRVYDYLAFSELNKQVARAIPHFITVEFPEKNPSKSMFNLKLRPESEKVRKSFFVACSLITLIIMTTYDPFSEKWRTGLSS